MTSPSYRLPDSLGGHECEIVGVNYSGEVQVIAVVAGMQVSMRLPKEWLVEVVPPLPPEPPHASVVLSGPVDAGVARAWQRDDHGPDNNEEARWYQAGGRLAVSWSHLCMVRPPVLLVPDPAAGAKASGQFPDTEDYNPPYASVVRLKDGRVRLSVFDSRDESAEICLSPDDAGALGRTLLAAARQP